MLINLSIAIGARCLSSVKSVAELKLPSLSSKKAAIPDFVLLIIRWTISESFELINLSASFHSLDDVAMGVGGILIIKTFLPFTVRFFTVVSYSFYFG